MPAPSPVAIVPTLDDAPFWAAAREKRLVFQTCADCGRVRHPPGPRCIDCRSDRVTWTAAPERAELYSWTVSRAKASPSAEPLVVGLVLFRQLHNVRLVTNIVAPPPENLAVGMSLRLRWQPCGDYFLPVFAGSTGA